MVLEENIHLCCVCSVYISKEQVLDGVVPSEVNNKVYGNFMLKFIKFLAVLKGFYIANILLKILNTAKI